MEKIEKKKKLIKFTNKHQQSTHSFYGIKIFIKVNLEPIKPKQLLLKKTAFDIIALKKATWEHVRTIWQMEI